MKQLTNRQKDILMELSVHQGRIKGAFIAQRVHISLRTLQKEIQTINRIMQKQVIGSDNTGYYLNEAITEQQIQLESYTKKDIAPTLTILKYLIMNDQSYDLDDLADALYMSLSSLQQQLYDLDQQLYSSNLRLIRQKHRIWIEGTELDKRRMIRHLIYQEAEPVFISLESSATYFEDMDMLRIKDIILQAIHHYHCYVEDCYHNNLMINITIALHRIRQGFSIEEAKDDSMIQDDFIEYRIAKEICDHYANHWSLPFQKQDIQYIAMLIMGQVKPEMLHQQIGEHHTMINEAFKEEVKGLLLKTFNYYMLSIDCDTFLYNFVLHIDALIKRSKANQHASNAIVHQIKETCPFIYDVAVFLSKEVEDRFQIHVTDEEIGLISIHIGFVIENSTKDSSRIKVLLLCNEYHHIVDTILERLKSNYMQTIEITNIVTNFNESVLESSADLIISTLPVRIIGKRVVLISPFYTMMDHMNIDQAINECLNEQKKRRDQQLLLSYFHEKLFFKRSDLQKKDDVIAFLGQRVIAFGLAQDGFIESVMKREAMSSTCFFETFAIPHAIELNAKKTMFCVLVNDQGISWDQHTIHLVFMITVQQKDRKAFMKIYNGIIQTLCQKEQLDLLVKADTLMEFIECFKQSAS